jgi:hypothetical protein
LLSDATGSRSSPDWGSTRAAPLPKLSLMAQISRPFQIVLVVFVLFALTWFAVLHRPGSTSSGGSGSSPSASSARASATSHRASVASATRPVTAHTVTAHTVTAHTVTAHTVTAHTVKVAGRASAKSTTPSTERHQAVAGSRHGAQSQHAAAHVSQTTPSAGSAAALTLHNLTAAFHLGVVVDLLEVLDPALDAQAKIAHAEGVVIDRLKAALQPASPATIAAELHSGKTVLLLFVNPHAYDDDATAIATVEVAHKLRGSVVPHLALANQVNSFGSITRDIQVYQTPTLLIVNPKSKVTPLTGLTDEFALEQAISEAHG